MVVQQQSHPGRSALDLVETELNARILIVSEYQVLHRRIDNGQRCAQFVRQRCNELTLLLLRSQLDIERFFALTQRAVQRFGALQHPALELALGQSGGLEIVIEL